MAFPTAQQIMAAAPKGGLQQLGELLQAGTQGYLQGKQIGQARDLSLIHISEPTDGLLSRMPSSA